jgi:hypothetical protein
VSAVGWKRILGLDSAGVLGLLACLREQLSGDEDLKMAINSDCRIAGLEALKALRVKVQDGLADHFFWMCIKQVLEKWSQSTVRKRIFVMVIQEWSTEKTGYSEVQRLRLRLTLVERGGGDGVTRSCVGVKTNTRLPKDRYFDLNPSW